MIWLFVAAIIQLVSGLMSSAGYSPDVLPCLCHLVAGEVIQHFIICGLLLPGLFIYFWFYSEPYMHRRLVPPDLTDSDVSGLKAIYATDTSVDEFLVLVWHIFKSCCIVNMCFKRFYICCWLLWAIVRFWVLCDAVMPLVNWGGSVATWFISGICFLLVVLLLVGFKSQSI